MDVVMCNPDPVGVSCVESVFPGPAIEAMPASQAAAKEKDCGASFDPHRGSQEMGAEQESEARDAGHPASSSEAPQRETTAEKNPWSSWPSLGWGKKSNPKTFTIVQMD